MEDYKDSLKFITLATSGGAARYLHGYLEGDRFSWKHFVANCFVSGFAGFIVSQIAGKLSPDWKYIAAGIGGFAGTQALDFIIYLIKKRYAPQAMTKEEVEEKRHD